MEGQRVEGWREYEMQSYDATAVSSEYIILGRCFSIDPEQAAHCAGWHM